MMKNMMISQSLILSVLLCSISAYPANNEKNVPSGEDKDLNTAETLWKFSGKGSGYSDPGAGGVQVQEQPQSYQVVQKPIPPVSIPSYYPSQQLFHHAIKKLIPPVSIPSYYPQQQQPHYTPEKPVPHVSIPQYYVPVFPPTEIKHHVPNCGSYPNSVYPIGYASSFPSYENYKIHGGHGFGKYGKHL